MVHARILAAICGLALATLVMPLALVDAQSSETGDDNEFGTIRMPYQQEMDGQGLALVAHVTVKDLYESKSMTYVMFSWDTKNYPALSAKFVSLKTADGTDLKVFDRQGAGTDSEKWFVDVKDMPPVGTDIVMSGTVDSNARGFFQVGTLVVPFTYRWEQVTMADGTQAKLYAFTQIGVNKESVTGGSSTHFGAPGGGKLHIPSVGLAASIAAGALVALATRRRKSPPATR